MVSVAIEEAIYIVRATLRKIEPIATQQQFFLNAYLRNIINTLRRHSYIY